MGPLFGAVMARALDTWWDELGRPDPFFMVEAGAGVGSLARDVLAASPRCGPALRYLLVERSAALRLQQTTRLPVDPVANVLGPVEPAPDGESRVVPGRGPLVASLEALPAGPLTGVVVANELLDNLPFAVLERGRDGWLEVRIDADLAEALVPARHELADEADALVGGAIHQGGRIPLQHAAQSWLREARRVVARGRVVAFDYATTTADLAARPWGEWVRTYRGHASAGDPLVDPGSRDITCEVCVDQLARAAEPSANRTQAEFLTAHGMDELVAEARAAWQAAAARPDVAALAARSRIDEAAALTDPSGLGAFRVLEWVVA